MADEIKPAEPTHTLVLFSKEEKEAVEKDIQAVLDKHQAVYNVKREIDDKGAIQAALQIFKLVPIEKKEEGIPSPIQAEDLKANDGGNNTETDPEAETASA